MYWERMDERGENGFNTEIWEFIKKEKKKTRYNLREKRFFVGDNFVISEPPSRYPVLSSRPNV